MQINTYEPIVNQINQLVVDIPGWTPLDELHSLFHLVISTNLLDGDIIEIGSWCGRSSVVLGLAASLKPQSSLFCIDLFPEFKDWYRNVDGTYSFMVKVGSKEYHAYNDQTVWREPFVKDIMPLYDSNNNISTRFHSAILAAGLDKTTIVHRGVFDSFIPIAPVDLKCRLAFIDGDHSYSAVVENILGLERYFQPGSWICFDDAFSHYKGVNDAIQNFIIDSDSYSCCQQLTRKLFVAQFVGIRN